MSEEGADRNKAQGEAERGAEQKPTSAGRAARRRARLSAEERKNVSARLRVLMPDAQPVDEDELNDLFFNLR